MLDRVEAVGSGRTLPQRTIFAHGLEVGMGFDLLGRARELSEPAVEVLLDQSLDDLASSSPAG